MVCYSILRKHYYSWVRVNKLTEKLHLPGIWIGDPSAPYDVTDPSVLPMPCGEILLNSLSPFFPLWSGILVVVWFSHASWVGDVGEFNVGGDGESGVTGDWAMTLFRVVVSPFLLLDDGGDKVLCIILEKYITTINGYLFSIIYTCQ